MPQNKKAVNDKKTIDYQSFFPHIPTKPGGMLGRRCEMRDRKITDIVRRERSTLLRLECGHDRSIGGHVWSNGKPTSSVSVGDLYECHDGHCWSANA